MNKLTQKELEIIDLVTLGLNNEEISKRLSLTTKKTNEYVSNIYQKLAIKDKILKQDFV